MSKHLSLLLLVIANIFPAALVLLLATCFDYVRFNPLFNPGYFAAAGIISAQVLILAIFTAFHDPRWPPLRWLSIAATLFISFTLFAVELACTHYLLQRRIGYIPAGTDRLLQLLYLCMIATAAVLAGCVAWILLLHIAAWPLRAMLGLRLIRRGEPDASSTARQFGITQLMAWVGLFAALLWLLKTAAGAPESLYPLLAILGVITASMFLVLPWTYFLFKEKIRLWPILVAFLGVAALSYAAEVTALQFNMFQISGRSAASTFLLPSFQTLEFGCFGGLAMLAAVLNFFALRRMGFRFQRAKAKASAPPHSTTIAPQPSNSIPHVSARS
jgi:hypothetical protein